MRVNLIPSQLFPVSLAFLFSICCFCCWFHSMNWCSCFSSYHHYFYWFLFCCEPRRLDQVQSERTPSLVRILRRFPGLLSVTARRSSEASLTAGFPVQLPAEDLREMMLGDDDNDDYYYYYHSFRKMKRKKKERKPKTEREREREKRRVFRLLFWQSRRNAEREGKRRKEGGRKEGRSRTKNRIGARSNIGIDGHGRYRTYAWSTNSSFLFR